MPDFRVSPISIVNQIKSNLQDRYDSGYPILKELLQNADDAEAQRFRLDALPGWTNAVNPLLRGPGLLVANDGFFRRQDESGITSFGESSKAADNAAIGKFGFGQKAVFHLCDAFIVYARRDDGDAFSTVVNPFLEVEVASNISRLTRPATLLGVEVLPGLRIRSERRHTPHIAFGDVRSCLPLPHLHLGSLRILEGRPVCGLQRSLLVR